MSTDSESSDSPSSVAAAEQEELPPEYDPEAVESKWQDRWVEANTYAYDREAAVADLVADFRERGAGFRAGENGLAD